MIPDAVDPVVLAEIQEGSQRRRPDEVLRDCVRCREPFFGAPNAKYCRDCRSFGKRLRKVKHQYGMSAEEYLALEERANGRCEACGQAPPTKGLRHQVTLHVDHNHKTGEVRGMLCSGCNLALGCIDDDPERALALAAYLRNQRPSVGDSSST